MVIPKYIVPGVFLSIGFIIIIPTIVIIILPFTTGDFTILFLLFVPLLWATVLFVFRKFFFSKILIDDDGIKLLYRNNVQRQIIWVETQKILVQRTSISFHKTSDKKSMWLTKNFIIFRLIVNYKDRPELEKICQTINENKHKISGSIEMIKPHPRIAELLR